MAWLLVGLWMSLIFQASSDRLSWERSSRFIGPVVRWLLPAATDDAVRAAVFTIRKCAHVAEYAVLTLLVWRAVRQLTGMPADQWCWRVARLSLGIVIFYAVTDELHQSLVPSRQGSALDVVVDATGAFFALLFLWAQTRWRGHPGIGR